MKSYIKNEIQSRILYFAIEKRYTKVLKYLINKGVDLNWQGEKEPGCLRPIEYACYYGNAEIVKLFVEAGCELNFYHSNVCQVLAAKNYIHTLRYLLEQGMTPDIYAEDERTGLHWAAQEGYIEIAKLLIDYGADVDAMENNGQTPLRIATAAGHIEVVKLLLENHAKVDLGTTDTPLEMASTDKTIEILKLLIQYGAEIDKRDSDGRTALFYAKAYKQKEAQKILLENGANTEVVDKYGISYKDLDKKEMRRIN